MGTLPHVKVGVFLLPCIWISWIFIVHFIFIGCCCLQTDFITFSAKGRSPIPDPRSFQSSQILSLIFCFSCYVAYLRKVGSSLAPCHHPCPRVNFAFESKVPCSINLRLNVKCCQLCQLSESSNVMFVLEMPVSKQFSYTVFLTTPPPPPPREKKKKIIFFIFILHLRLF